MGEEDAKRKCRDRRAAVIAAALGLLCTGWLGPWDPRYPQAIAGAFAIVSLVGVARSFGASSVVWRLALLALAGIDGVVVHCTGGVLQLW